MKTEGQVRIPSGCAIAAVISKEGIKMSGEMIARAMKPMHERSNGLGGGFAGYGIYPEYKDYYAMHMFFDSREIVLKEKTSRQMIIEYLLFYRMPIIRVSAPELIWREGI